MDDRFRVVYRVEAEGRRVRILICRGVGATFTLSARDFICVE